MIMSQSYSSPNPQAMDRSSPPPPLSIKKKEKKKQAVDHLAAGGECQ